MRIKSKLIPAFFITANVLFYTPGCSGAIIWPDKISISEFKEINQRPEEIWNKKQPAAFSNIESAGNNIMLITSHRGHVYLIDTKTGNRIGKIWQAFISDISSHSLNQSEDLLFISSRTKDQVIAHNIAKGQTLWKKKIINVQERIVSANGRIYIPQRDGTIIALDKKKGKKVTNLQLSNPINKGLYLWHDRLIVTTVDGGLTTLSRDLEIINSYSLELCSDPAITISDRFVIIVNCEGQIILLDQHGDLSRPFEKLPDKVYSPPQIIDQKLIIPHAGGQVLALDINSGKTTWKFENGDGLVNLPVQATTTQVIIPYSRGTIISLDLATGKEQWRYKLKRPIRHFKVIPAGLIVMDSKKYLSLIR